MQRLWNCLACIVFLQCMAVSCWRVRSFPKGFKFGAATAAYQTEGAWNVDGKGESIWDHFTHTNSNLILDHSNGDIATNSYYLYKRDVEIIRELGLDFYRISLSWTRILPNGFPNQINAAGVIHYNNVINELLKYNIQPIVTLYHWDLPQKLQELGGWTNPNIVNWFEDYAKVAFKLFGDRVKYWITINEPQQICNFGYGSPILAPGLNMKGTAEYLCAKNLLVAHATAYHVYNDQFRNTQNGNIFIALSAQWYEPASDEEDDLIAAYEANQFNWAIYSHPIFSKRGDFPPIMKKRIAAKSAEQGYFRSRLPEFTQEEINFIRGTADFFGLNHYSSFYVYRNASSYNGYAVPSFDDDLDVSMFFLPEWKIGESNFTMYVPRGFYKLLTQIRNEYGNPAVFITENGFATHGGLQDNDRVTYYRGYIDAMLDAVDEGSDIRAYTAWSLLDNFEWAFGYTERFGLYQVDFANKTLTRTPRKSAYIFKEIVRTRTLNPYYEPDMSKPLTITQDYSPDMAKPFTLGQGYSLELTVPRPLDVTEHYIMDMSKPLTIGLGNTPRVSKSLVDQE